VSHVFSGHRPVSPTTRVLVEDVARRLGYRPSAVARSLRSRRTDTIMIVVPDITNAFYPELARSVQDTVAPAGYHAMFGNTDALEENERALLELALSRRVDGLVFCGFRVAADDLVEVADAGISVVNLGQAPTHGDADSVRFDDRRAAHEAATFLVERYGSDVAMIDGDELAPVGRERRLGFEDACREAGLNLDDLPVVVTEFTRGGGDRGMRALLEREHHPRAVLCANDLIALGAIDVLKEAGLDVPGDVAVVGHDDIDAATIVTPQLTTTRTDAAQLGRVAGEMLVSRMSGEHTGRGRHRVIPHELVVRQSA
jgi:LacI family transcriptional regulator